MPLLLLSLLAGCTNLLDLKERKVRDGGGVAAVVGCSDYCAQANELCPGLFYKSDVGCLGVCAAYPPGNPADPKPTGNTLACRAKALENARVYPQEKSAYCSGAGPAGVGPTPQPESSCGTLCDSYCDLYKSVCSEIPDCKNKCLLLPDRPSIGTAQMDFESGADTVQCRLAHVTAAATAKQIPDEMMRMVHCNHSGLKSNQVCDVNDDKVAGIEIQCADFCKLTMGSCQGMNQVYETQAQCEAVCSKLPAGKLSELSLMSDSRRCRRENAYLALVETDPLKQSLQCADASPAPAHCGPGRCAAYCALGRLGCSAQFGQQFPPTDPGKCERDCLTMLPDQGQNVLYSLVGAATRGQPLNCRVLRVARALTALAVDMPIPPGTCEAAAGLPAPGGLPTECQ